MYHKIAEASAENLAASLPRQRAPADWASVEASHRLRSQARKLGEIAESLQDAQPPRAGCASTASELLDASVLWPVGH